MLTRPNETNSFESVKFYEQELNLMKSKIIELETVNKKLHQEIERLKKQNYDFIQEKYFQNQEKELIAQVEELQRQKSEIMCSLNVCEQKVQSQDSLIQSISSEKEQLQNELKCVTRKYESLQQEKLAIISTQNHEKSEIQEKQEEVDSLKEQVIKLSATIKRYVQPPPSF